MFPQLRFCFALLLLPLDGSAAESQGAIAFHKKIQPILENYCFDCHSDGANKGNVAFDEFTSDQAMLEDQALWLRALKNLRAGMMPPSTKSQPSPEERTEIDRWIKSAVFQINPKNPDPGRVTLRRLNRVEYRNTIRDLLGVNYNTEAEFPADDTGYGFDNIGDVLTLPPMLLEKYLLAANTIIAEAVPTTSRIAVEKKISGVQFRNLAWGENDSEKPLSLSFYEPASVSNTFQADHAGQYQLALNVTINEKSADNIFDYNKCRLVFKTDGKQLLQQDFTWANGKPYHFQFNQDWQAGEHALALELEPLTPGEPQTRALSLQVNSVVVRGPMTTNFWNEPKNYRRFFPRDVPENASARRDYARQLLSDFAAKAFRRPPEKATVDRLVALAETIYRQSGKTFESGVAQAMVAVIASPRFLFRTEGIEPVPGRETYPLVDEYALASRLSYFFWSSMPDEELFQLASQGQLRNHLASQTERMFKDRRSEAFIRNFTGQWLQARDIETVPIEAREVLARENGFDAEGEQRRRRAAELRNKPDEQLTKEERAELAGIRAAFQARRQPRVDLSSDLRRSMRRETEMVFEYILRENRSLLELIDSDYTFLNERLARHYGITNVVGDEMRRVTLPADSPRGGVITEGTVLAVTSNPTRTSPVKRGVFILDNILGTPSPPPPPNIPPLENSVKTVAGRAPTLRESLAVHRADPLCSSCHNRMDPLGLALENFNAMGLWRDQEYDQPIDPTGKLITGESFADVRELKRILVKNHARQFYQTLTEKLLTYALGRGLEYYDVETVDQIVAKIEETNGRPAALLTGIIESAPFQKTRGVTGRTKDTETSLKAVHQNPDDAPLASLFIHESR